MLTNVNLNYKNTVITNSTITIYITYFCSIINVLTLTFDQLYAYLQKESINFFQQHKKVPKHLIYIYMNFLQNSVNFGRHFFI